MNQRMSSLTTAAVSGLIAAGLFAAGCDEAEKAVNKGGDTPCSEFTAQDKDKQRTTVAKFLEQEQGGDVPNDQSVDRSLTAIELMCSAQANPDTPIRNADLTGILVPK
ncbi:hypothetical protein [Nocardia goodfellowii]|uniref:Acid stress chaperone HdeA n=1 Tax=Nocardia goodfellowii TaxID=882446 RepID=A0ABS4QJ04_9NOCA|nr:hypothetical protein [Nocardia goodfellowii]MBP2191676.1 acid stress chaperone HdeA [Nocardia goodfellowii]